MPVLVVLLVLLLVLVLTRDVLVARGLQDWNPPPDAVRHLL